MQNFINTTTGRVLIIESDAYFEVDINFEGAEAQQALVRFVNREAMNCDMDTSDFLNSSVTISSCLSSAMAGALHNEKYSEVDQTETIEYVCSALVAIYGSGNYVFDFQGVTYVPQKLTDAQFDFLLERLEIPFEVDDEAEAVLQN
ncbi:hypothetical protein ACFQPC_14770 [Herminiimonas glaciei]|uniref:Uncharacterized protein n=1 Tax=Herminiimonas glaciei TaxID=523788 RepID=A0ABW2IE65_9BURK